MRTLLVSDLIMADAPHNYTRLPGKLRSELGISKAEDEGARRRHNGPGKRKEQRKAARLEKKTKNLPLIRQEVIRRKPKNPASINNDEVSEKGLPVKVASVRPKAQKSILKTTEAQPTPAPTHSVPQKAARRKKNILAEEDAEIAALEKALGVKDKSRLPKTFEEDGLDELLEGLDDDVDDSGAQSGKRKLSDGHEWLKAKRQKFEDGYEEVALSGHKETLREDVEDIELESLSEAETIETEDEDIVSESQSDEEVFDGLSEGDEVSAESQSDEQSGAELTKPIKAPRENPYVAPVTASTQTASGKYVPPSLRNQGSTETEHMSRLRKQVQGLLNRLSEANMLSVVRDLEQLYQTNPRQHVSSTAVDLLLGLLSDPSSLHDTFIILHAGFIAALYKTVGIEFGAQLVQRIGEELLQQYEIRDHKSVHDKKLANLTSLIAELYSFHVIGSVLVYDLIRMFLNELSETNTELLLKFVRNAGLQLRQDDPSSLKAIVQSLQDKASQAGEQAVSTKIKFMMETMNSLKNNRMKTGLAASSVTSEHTLRMKKILGTLNQNHVKASEPLRISLQDLQDSSKRGKWWLIGSSYKDDDTGIVNQQANVSAHAQKSVDDTLPDGDAEDDLVQLAKEQRMNTSIRQSIFIAIMSATDCEDAHRRLIKLHLKKSQELEIPKVLLHCSGTEMVYNPFYTLLARKLCSGRKLKMAFQFSLWDVFRQLDEGDKASDDDDDDDNDQDREGRLGMRAIVNLARMFGTLIADDGLGLGVLKNLNLAYLQSRIDTFVEILLITVILQSQKAANSGERNEGAIRDIFSKPKEMPEMASGLQYYLKKRINKSDVLGDRSDSETVKWGCKVACSALKHLMSENGV